MYALSAAESALRPAETMCQLYQGPGRVHGDAPGFSKATQEEEVAILDGALIDRLHRCETLLAQHGVDVDKALAAPSPRPSQEPASAIVATKGARTPGVMWFAYYKEVR